MATSISVYSTITQADQLLIDVPENGLLQTRYFPTESKDEFQSKEVLLDFDEGDEIEIYEIELKKATL